MTSGKPRVFGIDFDPLDQDSLIAEIVKRAQAKKPGYVLPTNLHHAVLIRRDAALRRAFVDETACVVPDGRPLLWMARLHGIMMRLVTGSDLVVPLCRAAAKEQLSIFLFGAAFTTLTECGRRLTRSIPELRIAGVYSPPFGFETDSEECALARAVIQAGAPDITLVALGVPKQEIWAQKYTAALNTQVVCVGAAFDFLAGVQNRAPRLFRQLGFEWLWRALMEPRRLGIRYLRILCCLPSLVASDLCTMAWARTWIE
jgi:N-acetylglucosaminyldiphosphoundecaprenol N-acetyl-beta-D-mannosaminyltransferase